MMSGRSTTSKDCSRRASSQTLTSDDWALLYSVDPGVSELYDLRADPSQEHNVIGQNESTARQLHGYLVRFMKETGVPTHLLEPRMELRL